MILRFFLSPLSFIYWIGLVADQFFKYRRRKSLPRPVISVGNITWGGTGKTPLLIYLIKALVQRGLKPAVLSRGYQGVLRSTKELISTTGPELEKQLGVSDEIRLLSQAVPGIPIGVGANRAQLAMKIWDKVHPDMFLLDDGFQHWSIKRNVDIVCIDGTNPFGGDFLIPLGALREPLSALKRASIVVITRTELISPGEREQVMRRVRALTSCPILTPEVKLSIVSLSGETKPTKALEGKTVLAVSGIGNPLAFEKNIESFGARVRPMRFMDHYEYRKIDWTKIIETAQKESAVIVTTEKDFVKLKVFALEDVFCQAQFFTLRMELRFNPEQEQVLYEKISIFR